MPKRLLVSLLILACAGCARPVPTTAPATVPAADAPPWFRDATDELGIGHGLKRILLLSKLFGDPASGLTTLAEAA